MIILSHGTIELKAFFTTRLFKSERNKSIIDPVEFKILLNWERFKKENLDKISVSKWFKYKRSGRKPIEFGFYCILGKLYSPTIIKFLTHENL